MSQTRGIEVPIEHVTAELAAFPIASEAASRLSVVAIDPAMTGRSRELWRAAEGALVMAFPSFSVDEVVALRDWLWFHREGDGEDGASRKRRVRRVHETRGDTKTVSLVDFLRSISHATLEAAGNVFRPRMPPWTDHGAHSASGAADARARRFWRWVSFAIPPDLLMAAHGTSGSVAAEVEVVSPVLARILEDRGYVEPHMHVTAAIEFPLLWIACLHALANPEKLGATSFQSPGADHAEGRHLGQWLIRAAIARYVLAAFLATAENEPSLDLDVYLGRGAHGLDVNPGLGVDPGLWFSVRRALRELVGGNPDMSSPFGAFQRLYARLTRIGMRWREFPSDREQASRADPIDMMFPARGPGQRTAEMAWVAKSLDYIEGRGKDDRAYAHLFWQVVRTRNRFYRHVVQRPMTPGLQWFIRFFSRMKPARQPVGLELLVKNAASLCGLGRGLRAMEFRTSPEPDVAATRALVEKARAAVESLQPAPALATDGASEPGRPRPRHPNAMARAEAEMGLVLHFARDRGGNAKEGYPGLNGQNSHADPSWKRNAGYRYGWFYKQKRSEANAVARLLRRFPRVLRLLRGIDVCTDELGTPMWVMAPLCRYVKDVSKTASAYLQSNCGETVAPLRTTVHAGEEFIHLLNGLRRIDESVEMLHLGQGDRIGHAMALGVNARDWARRTSGVAVTKIERLLDLAWEWHFGTSRGVDISANRIQYVIDEIEQLSSEIFLLFAEPTKIVRFGELLRHEQELRALGFPSGPIPSVESYLGARFPDAARLARRSAISAELRLDDDTEGLGWARETKLRSVEPWNLLYSYLTEPGTFARGQKTKLIDPAFEAETLDTLQQELRRKLGAAGVTVEINPSSNLLIGNLGDLKNHPLWRLKPPRVTEGVVPVAVCIGSDNPLTFATRTREEYQLVYDTLTLAGLSDMEARQWLEEARQSGLESRFTLNAETRWSASEMWTSMDVDVRDVDPIL